MVTTDDNENGDTIADGAGSLTTARAAVLKNRTVYVNKRTYGLVGKWSDEIAMALEKENSDDILSEFIFSEFNSFKFVFYSPEQREQAIGKKIRLFSQLVVLEKPRTRPEFKTRTLHLTDIPIGITDTEVAQWLKSTYSGLQITSGFIWKTLRDSKIKSGVRTVVVQIPLNLNFPGYAWFSANGMKNAVKIRVWHYQMPDHCRRCMQPGHLSRNCMSQAAKSIKGSYAAAITTGRQHQTSEREAPATEKSAADQEANIILATPIVNTGMKEQDSEATAAWPTLQEANPKQGNVGKSIFYPFYTKKFIFSNHYPCTFRHKNTTFRSTEHFLFYEKASKMQMSDLALLIIQADTAAKAKQIGEAIPWDESSHGPWTDFAYNTLFTANGLKYETYPDLRHKLFETAPKTLVEASLHDCYWGVGLHIDDPKIHDSKLWHGQNRFGVCLTKLRDQMMANKDFYAEYQIVQAAKESANDEANRGKKRVCETTPPSVTAKRVQ